MVAVFLLIVVCGINIALASFVIASNTKARVNQVFAALAALLAIWSAVSFLEDTGISQSVVRGLVVADFALSAFMLGLFFWFCYLFTKRKVSWLATLVNALTASVVLMTIAGLMVQVNFVDGKVKFVEQSGYSLFIALAAVSLLSGLYMLIQQYRKSAGREREQLRFIFFGLFLMSFFLILTNVVLPNFYNVGPTITRLGIYSILFFTGFSSYVIVKHRLFNFRMAVARSVAYALLLTTLATVYGFISFGASNFLFENSHISKEQELFNIALAIVLAFTFQPLRRFFERLTDRIFYRDRYDSQVVLNGIGKILASEIQLAPLLEKTLRELCGNLHIQTGQLMVFDQDKIYKMAHFGPEPKKLLAPSISQHLRQPMLVADELESGQQKDILDEHDFRVSVMLRTHDQFVGFLFLGDKLSGDIYSNQDLRLLEILSSELAVAVTNAKSYEQIQQFNVTLQQKVKEATAELVKANENLKALDKSKDEFLSMASHQLRTPLTTIKGYLSMLLEGDAGKVSGQQSEFMQYAFDGSQRMVALVSDLLNVSRMSSGKFVIDRVPVDIVELVRQEVKQLENHAKQKPLELKFVPPKTKIPTMQLDDGKTRQVVMNFVDNAIYYTKQGSVTVAVNSDGQTVRVTVTDTGIGVPPEAKAKLFTKFYRADNAQATRPDGTGLGLYLAKRVVEDQGGKIIFESEMGKGSTFGFEMPLVAAGMVATPPEPVVASAGAK